MSNYKNKNGQIRKDVLTILNSWVKCNSNNHFTLLSNFYASRSTSYNSCFDSDLFIQSTDKEEIKAAGFSTAAKTIIKLNMSNPDIINFFSK